MALAYIDVDKIRLQSEWRERELCKEAGCKWDSNESCWWLPLSWASCVTLRGVFKEHLEIDARLSEWAGRELTERINPCLELRQKTEPVELFAEFPEGLELEPLQTTAVKFLSTAGRALCGDGMGSGKSVEALAAIEELVALHGPSKVFPCLIICTNSMVYQWKKEAETWLPHRSVGVLKGGAATRRKVIESLPDIMIANWEIVSAHTKLAGYGSIALTDKEKEPKELNEIPLRTVIADEAHKGKNPKAKQTRAWWRLSWDADFSFGLTGTPITRKPEDLWSIMHGIAPQEWPTKTAWIERYGQKNYNAFGGLEVNNLRGDTQDELFKYLDPRFIRRPTNVVIPNIVKKLEPQVRYVEMTPKQRTAYKTMKDEMIALLDDGGYTYATDHLSKMTRLLQLSSAFLEDDGQGGVHMIKPSCKIDALMDIMDELDEEPLAVFAESRQLLELAEKELEKAGILYGTIRGGVSELVRAEAVNKFQNGQLQVMLYNAAGAEGITLTRARHVLFMQRSFSLTTNRQAEDRVWRRGQDRPVQPIYLVTAGTIEEHVIKIGEKRDATFEEIVRDVETLRLMLQ